MTIVHETKRGISDAALSRARMALSKVSYSTENIEDVVQAAQHLPDVTVMAGATNTGEMMKLIKDDYDN